IAGETNAEKRRCPDALGQLATELASACDYRDSLQAFCSKQPRQNDGHHEMRRELCKGGCKHPGENDVRVEVAEGLSDPAEKEQEHDDHNPACQDVTSLG